LCGFTTLHSALSHVYTIDLDNQAESAPADVKKARKNPRFAFLDQGISGRK
jgi:hypothetical protein